MKYLLIIILLALPFQALADVEVVLHNNTEHTKTYFVYWLNHPYGCSMVFGALKCDFATTVGELKAGDTRIYILRGGHEEPVNEFMIKWENTLHFLKDLPDATTFHKFSLETNPKKIYSSPTYIN